MLSTPHVIVGAAIAIKIPNPMVAIPLAFCSHFVLEMVPHWNPHLNTEMRTHGHLTKQTIGIIIGDMVLAVASTVFLATTFGHSAYEMYTISAGSFAAIVPDILEAPYFFLHMKNSLLTLWLKFQKSIQSDAEPVGGLLTQLSVIIVTLLWLYKG